jgi:hypothetical protein
MDNRPVGTGTQALSPNHEIRPRRRRPNASDASLRYFLQGTESSPAAPELGKEVPSEGEALIQAFKAGQLFYTLASWKAVPELNGGGSPVIVKQAVARE